MYKTSKILIILAGLIFVTGLIARAADIKGRYVVEIHDSNKEPLPDVTITLKSTESAEVAYTITTNKKGKASIAGIDPIVYLLRIEKEGYQFREGELKLRAGVKVEQTYTLYTEEEAKANAIATAKAGMTEEELAHLEAIEFSKQGVEAFQNGKTEDAKKLLLDAIAKDPDISYVDYLILGNISFNEKNVDDTIRYLTKAKELDTEGESKLDIHRLLGASHMIKKEYDQAKETWMVIVDIDPEPSILYNLANIEIMKSDFDAATKWLEKCRVSSPDYTDGLMLLGDIYLQQKKLSEALGVYEQAVTALEKNPDPEKLKTAKDTVKVLKEELKKK